MRATSALVSWWMMYWRKSSRVGKLGSEMYCPAIVFLLTRSSTSSLVYFPQVSSCCRFMQISLLLELWDCRFLRRISTAHLAKSFPFCNQILKRSSFWSDRNMGISSLDIFEGFLAALRYAMYSGRWVTEFGPLSS